MSVCVRASGVYSNQSRRESSTGDSLLRAALSGCLLRAPPAHFAQGGGIEAVTPPAVKRIVEQVYRYFERTNEKRL
jgi:hypothetical protein